MRDLFLILFIVTTTALSLFAQIENDICNEAIELTDLVSWCSEPEAFSNINARDEGTVTQPFCFFDTPNNKDVWFSFIAIANTVNVSVTGDYESNVQGVGGTLEKPNLAIYRGNCGNLVEEECVGDGIGNNTINTLAGPLSVGATYYIRVSAQDDFEGTFQLCINNFNSVPEPSGDCVTGVVLCDKSPFSVEEVSGVGQDPNEITNLFCGNGQPVSEFATSWYKWTCDQPGSLIFTLTPINPADDLDFYLYELPTGIDNCGDKILLRSMSSGEQGGAPFSVWEPCTGPTGLSLSENDVNENCGCDQGDNNFIAGINMVAGKSYALVISNFTNSGSGFAIEFGGTGTFLGPTAAFDASPQAICIGESITFNDASSFVGNLVGWAWNFGPDADVTTINGQGPHTVAFNRPGVKSVQLTVEAERGCIVTTTAEILVECCAGHFDISGETSDLRCPGADDGSIDLIVDSPFPPYDYSWSNGAEGPDLSGLPTGTYTVSVTDEVGCQTTLDFLIDSPPEFAFDTLVTMPTCNGGTDGAVSLVVNGGTPGYEFNWQNMGFRPDNSLQNISQGDYSVVVRDQHGCETPMVLPVRELELILDPAAEAIVPPSCFGFADASISVDIGNGLPAYQYNFNDGNGFVSSDMKAGLTSGTYTVNVQDANLCRGAFEFTIADPPPLVLDFDTTHVSCFGLSDGSLTALPGGGVGGYTYSWNSGPQTPAINNLVAGTYAVTVLDANGCVINDQVNITQPNPLFIDVTDVRNNICFGEAEGRVDVLGSGGTGPYEYSVDGIIFQPEPAFAGLRSGTYTFTVLDALGCTETVQATVTQPDELLVDAGEDQSINLGYSTDIRAVPSEPDVTYQWTPADSSFFQCVFDDCQLAEVMPVNTTTFQITVTDSLGCTATDSVRIRVIKLRPLYIPNAFSPNGDGPNDRFTVYAGPGVAEIASLRVFDRWGNLVFERQGFAPNDDTQGWDGTFRGQALNSAVFVYVADVRYIDNTVVTFKGNVTLVR